MAGGFVDFLLGDVRRFHADVAGGELGFFRELFQFLDDHRAFRQPERQAGADVFGVNHVQAHLRADLAVVAFLGLLQHLEVGLHLGLVLERRAVDALELRVFLVALVVRAGDAGELERADVAGAHHVRPGAEVNEVAVLEIGNLFAFGNVLQIADLELARITGPLAQPAEPAALRVFHRLLACDNHLLEDVVRLDLFLHLLFDLREVFRRDAMLQLHVVVKPVLHRRPGGKLRVRPQPQNGRGHHVGGRMPEPFELGHLRALIESFAFHERIL